MILKGFNSEKSQVHVIQWTGYCDDYFHIKYEKEKPPVKLIAKRSNENVIKLVHKN